MRRRLELPALSHQQPCLPPCTHNPEEHEEMKKERDSRCLVKIMIIMAVITAILVKSYDDSGAFTHGFLDTMRICKIAGYSPAHA